MTTVRTATYRGRRALVIHEQTGRVLLKSTEYKLVWVLIGAPELEFSEIEMSALVGCRAEFLGTPGVVEGERGESRLTFRADDQTAQYAVVYLTLDHPGFYIEVPDVARATGSRGRPRVFGSNAEKQRAYRERHKALRNSIGDQQR